jgi:hypothetical protein
MPVILANWEAEIRRIGIQGQPRQKVCEIPISTEKKKNWVKYRIPVIPATSGSLK